MFGDETASAASAAAPREGPGAPWRRQLLVVALVLVYYRLYFGSVDGLAAKIDHLPVLFADFVNHYYETGKHVFDGGMPSGGYFYPASFAILIGPLCALPLPWAELLWGCVEIALSLAACLVLPYAIAPASRDLILLHTFLMSTSVPLLHNFKWGQVSVPVLVLVFCAHAAYARARRARAAGLFGAAVAVKGYPALFLVWPAVRRDVRFLLLAAAACVALVAALPVAVMGIEHASRFQAVVTNAALAATDGVLKDHNSQYFAAVVGRLLGGAEEMPPAYWQRMAAAGYALFGALLLLLAWMERAGVERRHLWAFSITSCALPFLLKTSWTHYMVHLPVVQVFLIDELRRSDASPHFKAAVVCLLVLPSMFLGNIAALGWFGGWLPYASAGSPFYADALTLAASVVVLARAGERGALGRRGPRPLTA